MKNKEKVKYVKKHVLAEALSSLESDGMYWNATISRTLAPTLKYLIEEAGYEVFMQEIPPDWEHVYYIREKSDSIEEIANKRSAIRA